MCTSKWLLARKKVIKLTHCSALNYKSNPEMKLGRPCQANFSVQLQRPPTVNTKAALKEIEKCCF